jgi:N-acetylglucosaminyldiphosphoundecaprenol N-acetyl-beta-D-mannosaminyltransferase
MDTIAGVNNFNFSTRIQVRTGICLQRGTPVTTNTTESIASQRTTMARRPEVSEHAKAVIPPRTFPILRLFGFNFRNITLEQAADALVEDAEHDHRTLVYFMNAHCINTAARDETYCNVLHKADLLFADGAGLALAARIWGERFEDNVNGTDLFPLICARVVEKGLPIALLGAKPGVVRKCAENLLEKYPGLKIAWLRDGYHNGDEQEEIIDAINRSGARMLFVAKGVPLQENWIHNNAAAIKVPVIMGVGALFDFCSGTVPRAPLWMRKIKLEWLFRLGMEPKRLFKRYVIGNPLFVYRALKRRFLEKTPASNICSKNSRDR